MMILRRTKFRQKSRRDECLDLVHQEVLLAVRVSDEEIEAASNSPDLCRGLRSRIAAERDRRAGGAPTLAGRAVMDFFHPLHLPHRTSSWALTAAAVLLIVALGLFMFLPSLKRESMQVAQPEAPPAVPSSPVKDAGEQLSRSNEPNLVTGQTDSKQQPRISRQQRRSDRNAGEIATDFMPLTFTADASTSEGGHLVRVTIPRSALVAMGLPVNTERAGELLRADVFFGDDGLARAIRFIQ